MYIGTLHLHDNYIDEWPTVAINIGYNTVVACSANFFNGGVLNNWLQS